MSSTTWGDTKRHEGVDRKTKNFEITLLKTK